MHKCTIIAQGKVQGVFYRLETAKTARKLGLTGWVKNESAGSVKIVAVGSAKDLEKLVKWCNSGPPLAKVTKVEVEWEKAVKNYKRFIVKY
ncbi:acylphosphatase [Candidatus Parcubacteria bacterium]|nr:acylphosphatase [Candidatus Parcubacteria bacterium]